MYLELIIEDNVFYSKPQYFSKSFPFHFFSLTLKDFLGLSDISTTSRYAYADNEDIKKALETVQEKLSH